MTPEEVLANVRNAYASCHTYQDRGDVVNVDTRANGRRRTRSRPFRTWFTRPDYFRFEFADRDIGPEEEWDRYVVWRAGAQTRTWWSVKGEDAPESLSMALAGATGISGSSAIRVPRLLIPELGGKEFPVRLAADETIGGRLCKVLLAGPTRGEETWAIDAETWMLLRVTTRTVFDQAMHEELARAQESVRHLLEAQGLNPPILTHTDDWVSDSTTTYEPTFDADIPAETFHFRPPGLPEP